MMPGTSVDLTKLRLHAPKVLRHPSTCFPSPRPVSPDLPPRSATPPLLSGDGRGRLLHRALPSEPILPPRMRRQRPRGLPPAPRRPRVPARLRLSRLLGRGLHARQLHRGLGMRADCAQGAAARRAARRGPAAGAALPAARLHLPRHRHRVPHPLPRRPLLLVANLRLRPLRACGLVAAARARARRRAARAPIRPRRGRGAGRDARGGRRVGGRRRPGGSLPRARLGAGCGRGPRLGARHALPRSAPTCPDLA